MFCVCSVHTNASKVHLYSAWNVYLSRLTFIPLRLSQWWLFILISQQSSSHTSVFCKKKIEIICDEHEFRKKIVEKCIAASRNHAAAWLMSDAHVNITHGWDHQMIYSLSICTLSLSLCALSFFSNNPRQVYFVYISVIWSERNNDYYLSRSIMLSHRREKEQAICCQTFFFSSLSLWIHRENIPIYDSRGGTIHP